MRTTIFLHTGRPQIFELHHYLNFSISFKQKQNANKSQSNIEMKRTRCLAVEYSLASSAPNFGAPTYPHSSKKCYKVLGLCEWCLGQVLCPCVIEKPL